MQKFDFRMIDWSKFEFVSGELQIFWYIWHADIFDGQSEHVDKLIDWIY